VKRTILLSAAVAAAAATITPVHAGPAPADAGRVAVAQLSLHLSHGRTLLLELRAATLSGGNTLRVLARRCHADGSCAASTDAFQSALAPAALTVDPTSAVAELRATIGGHALHVRWQPGASNTEQVGGIEGQGDSISNSGSWYQGSAAVTGVELDGRACNGTGAVGTGVFADTGATTGSSGTAPLSALHVPATAPLTCG